MKGDITNSVVGRLIEWRKLKTSMVSQNLYKLVLTCF